MVEYCPYCKWSMELVYFYGNNGMVHEWCCTFCGYHRKTAYTDDVEKYV